MEIANLKQPPLNATLMGCVKGAADYFDADLSVPMLYGLTGHAFLLNIHKDLCPSSPYVWKKSRFRQLLAGIGVETVAEYELSRQSPEPERRRVEEELKTHLNDGRLCMLDFLEHQLISGYDETGFLMLRPWNGHAPSEVPELKFGTWEPCFTTEGWAHLTVIARTPAQKPVEAAARDALEFARFLWNDPSDMEVPGYRIGAGAYENWINGVERGLGTEHGHWWNGTVWSECRLQAAAFFQELGELVQAGPAAAAAASELQKLYGEAGAALAGAKEKNLDKTKQLRLLRTARDAEAATARPREALIAAL